MRLLKYHEDGELSITSFEDSSTPPYAILSHTWGGDAEEVTLEDLARNAGKEKEGYKKITFCGKQAHYDGLQYFWIDTCCIDKTDKAELSHSIQSMFRWYRNAERCYVYLSDVSFPPPGTKEEVIPPLWESDFRKSRWFTRGWTLQELLAPRTVEFFSQEQRKIGDKASLKSHIHKTTNIPHAVLEGAPLSQFSVTERLRWRDDRQTQREEDGAYSLLGIFDVDLAPVYGEGAEGAFRRLMDEIHKLERCIQDIRSTDSRDDKKRIEETRGGLLKDSYSWVLNNSSFQQWHNLQSQLLWVKGDPGKGKTMLLCGIIDELQKSTAKNTLVSYFFCQATDSRINSAVAVLRGLLYLLVCQQPSLVSHIRVRYDRAGKALFEDANAWVALTEILVDVLHDPNLNTTYIIIDALDECVTNLPELLDFVAKQSSASSASSGSPSVKWIISSRNWPDIEERLEGAGHKIRLSLELNAESVSAAVSNFIEQKVSQLAQQKKYDEQTRIAVLEHLKSNANDTFLWVALVCQDLQATARRNVLKKLDSFPPKLDSLYERMIQQINTSDDAELCKQVLATISLVYRPITLEELVALVEQLEDINDNAELREIIGVCGSFLTIQKNTIYLVHQSAKDFLLSKAGKEVFPSGIEVVHHDILTRSLQVMSKTLRKDVYGLEAFGYPASEIKQPDPDPLASSRYSCIYWVDHLGNLDFEYVNYAAELQDEGVVNRFLTRKYLYWLEALSICQSVSKGVLSVASLLLLVQRMGQTTSLAAFVQDAYRFIMYHKGSIESSPLQAYVSALVFSPTNSLVRKVFQHEEPEWITVSPAMDDSWSACLQTLEGHSEGVSSVAFSHNSIQLLASASDDNTVKIWDIGSGACLQTLRGHSNGVTSVVFSHGTSQLLATGSHDNTIRIWDVSSGVCLQTLEGHELRVSSVAFSRSNQLASASHDHTIKIWNISSGVCMQTLRDHSDAVSSVAFSNSDQLASGSHDNTIKIWDTSNGACQQTLKGHSNVVTSVAFSHGINQFLATGSYDETIKIWDTSDGACLQTLESHSDWVNSVAFSYDSTQIASSCYDGTIRIWNVSSGTCLQTVKGHSGWVTSVAFSQDLTQLASASEDKTVKIWDAGNTCLQTIKGHSDWVTFVALSPDSTQLASASYDVTVKIWDASGTCLHTLEDHSDIVFSVAFSHDSTQLATASDDDTVKIWDSNSGACLHTIKVDRTLYDLYFDPTGSLLHHSQGAIDISSLGISSTTDTTKLKRLQNLDISLSSDSTWIVCSGENLLWIPSEYRPSCSSVSGCTIGLGVRSGRVWLCTFHPEHIRDAKGFLFPEAVVMI